jgi:hypothetical protein
MEARGIKFCLLIAYSELCGFYFCHCFGCSINRLLDIGSFRNSVRVVRAVLVCL